MGTKNKFQVILKNKGVANYDRRTKNNQMSKMWN